MRIYFYHTQDTRRIAREWRQGVFPAHFLYGALQLERMGHTVVWHDQVHLYKRVRDTWRATWRVLACRQPYDVLYATHTRGIEPIVLLRALGLYRKPIVVWHHQPIVKARSLPRELLARLFYKGLDHMIFFSERLVADSMRSRKADAARMSVARWGADLDFYDRLRPDGREPSRFISTGKERRDYVTLTAAFARTGLPLSLYAQEQRRAYFETLPLPRGTRLVYCDHLMPYEISLRVAQSRCVCVCCQRSDYTVGLTTVVEALALGLPVLCTRNPTMPVDLEKEGCGLWIEPGDTQGWADATRYIDTHPAEAREMGQRGRRLAEREYNVERCARDAEAALRKALER